MSTTGRHRPSARGPVARSRVRPARPLDRSRIVAFAAACTLLAAAALVALLLPGPAGRRPPTPPAPAAGGRLPTSVPSPAATSRPRAAAAPFRCRAAHGDGGDGRPQRICIPRLRVDADVLRLGLNADRTVQVPPLSRVGEAGWYRYSALPGAVGPTVILGHVDSAQYGDGVFYALGRLHRGDTVSVARSDGRTAVFVVVRVEEIAKSRFPTQRVYGPTSGPALRLVTCGGRFDAARGSYVDNIIAYGTLRSLS